MLDDYGDGLSVNKTLKELLEDVEVRESLDEPLGFINITMDDDVHDKLTKCRIYPDESLASVIYRLISDH